jgi:protoheme IX farnesyltransferase
LSTNFLKQRTSSTLDISSFLKSLILLLKPRVMSLVIFTCAVGYITSNTTIETSNAIIGIILVAIGAGAAGCLNMWYDSDIDAVMTRTCLRPIPTGKITKNYALIYGIVLTILSVVLLNHFTNTLSAALLLFTILFYIFVYTIWLKRKTPQNIVIGGAAGALPPIIGWTIATNSISLEPISLFFIIFFWTPSHFWALSLYKASDYKKANIPMLPVSDGIEKTKLHIFIYSLLMMPVVLLPYLINFAGLIYLIPTIILTIYYNYICYELLNFKKNKFDTKKAKKIFTYSIFYLFIIFVLLLADSLI